MHSECPLTHIPPLKRTDLAGNANILFQCDQIYAQLLCVMHQVSSSTCDVALSVVST